MRYNEGAMKNTTRKSLIAAIAVYGLAVLTTTINAQPATLAQAKAAAKAIADGKAKIDADLANATTVANAAKAKIDADLANAPAVAKAAKAKLDADWHKALAKK